MTAPKPYTHMTADDVRELATITFDIYDHHNWSFFHKHMRVVLLLTMFANLEQSDDAAYPTIPRNIKRLAEQASVRQPFAVKFITWLTERGYIVRVTPTIAAFAWHVKAADTGAGGDNQS